MNSVLGFGEIYTLEMEGYGDDIDKEKTDNRTVYLNEKLWGYIC